MGYAALVRLSLVQHTAMGLVAPERTAGTAGTAGAAGEAVQPPILQMAVGEESMRTMLSHVCSTLLPPSLHALLPLAAPGSAASVWPSPQGEGNKGPEGIPTGALTLLTAISNLAPLLAASQQGPAVPCEGVDKEEGEGEGMQGVEGGEREEAEGEGTDVDAAQPGRGGAQSGAMQQPLTLLLLDVHLLLLAALCPPQHCGLLPPHRGSGRLDVFLADLQEGGQEGAARALLLASLGCGVRGGEEKRALEIGGEVRRGSTCPGRRG